MENFSYGLVWMSLVHPPSLPIEQQKAFVQGSEHD